MMEIRDVNGKYVLKIDKQRRIVYEANIGMWEKEDFERFVNDYKNKVIPYLGKSTWVKFSDLRKYMPSTKVKPEMINEYLRWAAENGFKYAAMIVDSATLKMQMNRSTKDVLDTCYFDTEKDADAWLKSKGF